MSQFDVYRLGEAFVLDCQTDLLSDLNTRFVVPLLPIDHAPKPANRLNPLFDIDGQPHVMATQFAATLSAGELKVRILSLNDDRLVIGKALDMLISGH